MNWFARLWRRRDLERRLDQELRFHMQERMEELLRGGAEERDARRQARLEFGGLEQAKEQCRDARGTRWAESLLQDLRYAARTLLKARAVAPIAVAAMALGIGATTVIFSAVYAVLLSPLPWPEADRLVALHQRIPSEPRVRFSPREFLAWTNGTRAFSSLGAYAGNAFTLTGRGEPLALYGTLATPSLFEALGVRAAFGRTFQPREGAAGHEHVLILSDALWRDRFNADPNIIGQSATLSGESYTIVGVMPPGFSFPSRRYSLWIPAALESGIFRKFPDAHLLSVAGRLASGVSFAQLQSEIDLLSRRAFDQDAGTQRRVWFQPLAELSRSEVRRPLITLLSAVAFVLLIACANVAGLLLARSTGRRGELAVRIALGAPRRRLIQQLLIEACLIAAAGGLLGSVLAGWGVTVLRKMGAATLPGVETARVNLPVLLFAAAISVLTGLVFGVVPSVIASRRAAHERLRSGPRGTRDRTATWAQSALVSAEIALCVVLLTGAGLMIHSFVRLASVDPGFRAQNVLTASVVATEASYRDANQVLRLYNSVLDGLRAIPGAS
ncbi:MAG TPA: ABC transporter permease, partial [Bryobacteraceae bacterium]|nr:ABC transporter permease [Bryobacteraceae bacterium]